MECESTEMSNPCTFGVSDCCFDCDKRTLEDFCKQWSDEDICDDLTCIRKSQKSEYNGNL